MTVCLAALGVVAAFAYGEKMEPLIPRTFALADVPACLAIFDSNVPTFFAREERAEFAADLAQAGAARTPYLVLTRGGSVIACGGLSIAADRRSAALSWGMVDRRCHGQGIGTTLTEARLNLARAIPGLETVVLSTSQRTREFYEKFGFRMTRVTPDGFGAGLDRWDMALRPEAPPHAP